MIRVVILGSGNLASHLSLAFKTSNKVELLQIYGRSKESLKNIDNQVDRFTNLDDLVDADVYIIAISDDHIAEFSAALPLQNKLVVHTSGAVSCSDLDDNNRKGVFYPLQSFTKNAPLNFTEIPICIEAEDNQDLVLLEQLAAAVSEQVYFINSKQRKHLHLAAVFVNNFVNHLYTVGHQICTNEVLPFEILKPLIRETARKLDDMPPRAAQTGPAKRKDQKTMDGHKTMLSKDMKELYQLLSKSIQATHGKEL